MGAQNGLGEPGLIRGIRTAGSVIEKDPLKTDIVVVGNGDTGLTYEKIKLAYLAISHGALFWDHYLVSIFPVPGGFYPGAGSVRSFCSHCGRPPAGSGFR